MTYDSNTVTPLKTNKVINFWTDFDEFLGAFHLISLLRSNQFFLKHYLIILYLYMYMYMTKNYWMKMLGNEWMKIENCKNQWIEWLSCLGIEIVFLSSIDVFRLDRTVEHINLTFITDILLKPQ